MDNDYWGYPPSVPIATDDGIKAQSKRGSFASNWWAKRWLAALQTVSASSRLARGKRYARSGQVLGIKIEQGLITAGVQGSRVEPYTCSIRLTVLPEDKWQAVAKHLVQYPMIIAKLLTGVLPKSIEQVFADANVCLFPKDGRELQTHCSCPDWENPCKHLAAVFYLVGEEFDRDPWQYLMFRGITRDEFLKPIRGAGASSRSDKNTGETLVCSPEVFWFGESLPDNLWPLGQDHAQPLVDRLGPFPLWRGNAPLATLLEPVYATARELALELLMEDSVLSDDGTRLSVQEE